MGTSSKEVLLKLHDLNKNIQSLLYSTMVSKDFGELDEAIEYEASADELMLKDEIYKILEKLDDVSSTIQYLHKKVKEQGYLRKNSRGRYVLKDREFTCGSTLEILIYDDFEEKEKWVHTRIEHNGKDYYAIGVGNVNLDGIMARVRG